MDNATRDALRYTAALKKELAKDGIQVNGWKAFQNGTEAFKRGSVIGFPGKTVWKGFTVNKAITQKSRIIVRSLNGRFGHTEAQLTLDGSPFEGIIGLHVSFHE